MKRREFIALIGASAVLWPIKTKAQGAPTYRAIDISDCPSDKMIAQLRAASFSVVGVYLRHCPQDPDPAGNAKCGLAKNDPEWRDAKKKFKGWGFIPTFCGSQPYPHSPCPTIDASNAAQLGADEGDDAVQLMNDAMFEPGSVVYFDLEASQESLEEKNGPYIEFLRTWANQVRKRGFTPGIYTHSGQLNDLRTMTGVKLFWAIPEGFHYGDRPSGHPVEVVDPTTGAFPKGQPIDYPFEPDAVASQYAFGYQIKGVDDPTGYDPNQPRRYDIDAFRLSVCRVSDPSNKVLVCEALGIDPNSV
jgi:hypothetical protein